jgi:hypothetical protein
LCKIIQTLNGPKPDLLRLDGGGLQRSLGKAPILTGAFFTPFDAKMIAMSTFAPSTIRP